MYNERTRFGQNLLVKVSVGKTRKKTLSRDYVCKEVKLIDIAPTINNVDVSRNDNLSIYRNNGTHDIFPRESIRPRNKGPTKFFPREKKLRAKEKEQN